MRIKVGNKNYASGWRVNSDLGYYQKSFYCYEILRDFLIRHGINNSLLLVGLEKEELLGVVKAMVEGAEIADDVYLEVEKQKYDRERHSERGKINYDKKRELDVILGKT